NEKAHPKPRNQWQDPDFASWGDESAEVFIDDDLLGFMSAQAAKEDGSDEEPEKPKGKKGKGTVTLRRGVLEVSRAMSLTPGSGDRVYNSCSPWANLGSKDKDNPYPYGT